MELNNVEKTEVEQVEMEQEIEVEVTPAEKLQQAQPTAGAVPGKSKATVALVLSIVSLVLAWFGWLAIIGLVVAIVAVVLGVQARKEMPEGTTGMATAGFVMGIIGIALNGILFIACGLCLTAAGVAGLSGY